RSLARLDWPTDIVGAESAIDGLDVAETETHGGREVAIPLRALVSADSARIFAHEGIACLVCRPDRDQAWFVRTPSLHGLSAMAEADRKIMESFNSLPFRFVSAYFENLLRNNSALFAGTRSSNEAAAAIAQLLDDVLMTTGPGASARVVPTGETAE